MMDQFIGECRATAKAAETELKRGPAAASVQGITAGGEQAAASDQDQAATKVQAMSRAASARKQVNELKAEDAEKDAAATKVQAIVRGNSTRKTVDDDQGDSEAAALVDRVFGRVREELAAEEVPSSPAVFTSRCPHNPDPSSHRRRPPIPPRTATAKWSGSRATRSKWWGPSSRGRAAPSSSRSRCAPRREASWPMGGWRPSRQRSEWVAQQGVGTATSSEPLQLAVCGAWRSCDPEWSMKDAIGGTG